MSAHRSTTLAKGLMLLKAILSDEGRSSLSLLAARENIPLPTAHRLAATLEEEGFIERVRKGYFHPGPTMTLLPIARSPVERMASRLRRPLARLAKAHGAFAHFGILEDGMVTYLVKENGTSGGLFTEENMQLEAYCSAIGKILLSSLPAEELENYLANGPFIALTERTLTSAEEIRNDLDRVRKEGVAFDRYEIRDDLYCIAVPVRSATGQIAGGISLSFLSDVPSRPELNGIRNKLKRAAAISEQQSGENSRPV